MTASNGFIGSYLGAHLKNKFTVTSISKSEQIDKGDCISVDLSDLAGVRNFVDNSQKFDTLIFLVGLAHKKGKGKKLDEFRRINKQTLVNLLSKLDEKNKLPEKIIFATHQTRITIHRFNNRKININNSE